MTASKNDKRIALGNKGTTMQYGGDGTTKAALTVLENLIAQLVANKALTSQQVVDLLIASEERFEYAALANVDEARQAIDQLREALVVLLDT